MYEPDLVTIGDNVVVDNSYVLGHVGQGLGVTFAQTKLCDGAYLDPGCIMWAGDELSKGSRLHSNSKLSARCKVRQAAILHSSVQ